MLVLLGNSCFEYLHTISVNICFVLFYGEMCVNGIVALLITYVAFKENDKLFQNQLTCFKIFDQYRHFQQFHHLSNTF